MKFVSLVLAACCATFLPAAADPAIPYFWDAKERLTRPDLSAVTRLRFLTTIDFPPFNFIDSTGRISGFNVDLARAICAELGITDKCQIQALPWNELEQAVEDGEGEAIIAGLAVTEANRRRYGFSRSYLRFPARFVMRRADAVSEPLYRKLAGERVGVVAGSAHERALRDLFPEMKPVTYSRSQWMFDDLKDGKIAAVFSDGMRLGFWLAGSSSQRCCRFAGGPYLAPEYFGDGLAIAAPADRPELVQAFDYALREINAKGKFAEFYLRYFPVSFF